MRRKYILLILILLCLSNLNLLAINIPAGNVSGHWTLGNSPYLILGNITVPQDSLLEIDAGVVVNFQGHFELKVNGRILAIGISADPIYFTALSDWWGFRYDGILSTQDSSIFVYCNIEKGNANGTGNYRKGGAFYVSNFSKIRIELCSIANNIAADGGGFYFDNANPKIYRNDISYNVATNYYGGGIYCYFSSPSILNNIITHNGEQIECDHSSPDIIGNTISNSGGHAIGCENSSTPSIINNIISHNILGIVLVGCSADVIGNVITYNSGNDYGTGIMTYGAASPKIINNTIAYNSADIYGGGIYIQGDNTPVIINNIIWGNYAPQGEQVSLQSISNPSFFNCDIQGGSSGFYFWDMPYTFTGTYLNNLDSDPLFINTVSDFSLLPNSPCVNAGDTTGVTLPLTDIGGNTRICDGVVEIGAYEICSTVISVNLQHKIKVEIYPNPSHDLIVFEISDYDLQENLTLHVTDEIGSIDNKYLIRDTRTKISLNQLTSGLYFYQLKNETEILCSGKIIRD